MSLLFGILLGMLTACALPRRGQVQGQLGGWRPLAGAVGGAWPHVGTVLAPALSMFTLGSWAHGLTHSLLLLPLAAVVIALMLFGVSQRRGQERPFAAYFPIVLAAAGAAWLLQLLTRAGVVPFAPLWSWRVSFNWVVPFDYNILALLTVGGLLAFAIGLVWPPLRRWVSRLTLLLLIGYLLVMASFQMKAAGIAKQYARAFNLQGAQVYALPGPLSPLNWRLIVIDEQNRLHDTMIHLTRTQPLVVTEHSKRAHRLKALYKPVNQAVWRIYPRFGGRSLAMRAPRVQAAWQALHQPQFRWATRFAVARRTEEMANERCVVFRDLRFEGARHDDRGTFLSCPQSQHLYRERGEKWHRLR